MSRKRSTAAAKVRVNRVNKVKALIERPGSVGEQQAAKAALERMAPVARPTPQQRQPFSEADIKKLAAPAKGNKIYLDVKPGGFGVRVTAAGTRAYILDYRVKGSGQQRRITIGACGNWSLGAARNEAKRLRQIIDGGGDPLGEFETQREAPTVAELCDRFEREQLPKKSPATQDSYARLLKLHIRPHFGAFKKVSEVRFRDVDKMHAAITEKGSVYSANRAVAVFSRMMTLAVQWEWCDKNPCRGVEKNPEAKRRRYLSADELARLTVALSKHPDKQFATIVGLLVLTGARRGEVLSMRWSGLTLTKDKSRWSKLASETKQRREHSIPLSAPACQLLSKIKKRGDSDFVFPSDSKSGHVEGIKKSWATLLKSADITGLRVHDLRHSYASMLVSSGASLPLVGAMLGHSSTATTARYSHLHDDPQREAAEIIGAIVGKGGV
jgi:integrase